MRLVRLLLTTLVATLALACANLSAPLSALESASSALTAAYPFHGDTRPVHDPSLIREGGTWYLFTTDVIGQPAVPSLPIRCSGDQITWSLCGSVFPGGIPAWVEAKVPGVIGLWAPDISYFGGLYHLYYAGSTLNSNRSVIGVATNKTLDPKDPAYGWEDGGEVLESVPSSDFNAIDPKVLVDTDGRVWMSYGSYWSGIKQVELDPATGRVEAGALRYDLAVRPNVTNDPIEGASLVHHGGFYYLFVSIDYCCNSDVGTDNYKEAVGRSSSPHGPFYDMNGTSMMQGGGTVVLSGNGTWNAPGGGSVFLDARTGEASIAFHALNMQENGSMYLWLKQIGWDNEWPVLKDAVPARAF